MTQNLTQKIALGATCSILLLAFSSVTRYEQPKKNIIAINTATVATPTPVEPAAALAQSIIATPTATPTKVPEQQILSPIPTIAIRQATPIPTQSMDIPTSIQTTPQAQPTQIAAYTTRRIYIIQARSAATRVGINADYFVHQIQLESNFNPSAQSPSGATGIAQFMPATASGLGIDPTDPIASLNGAAQMMARLAHQFGNNYAKALAAYNLGSMTVKYAERTGGKNWFEQLPVSTQNYILQIMNQSSPAGQ